MNQHSKYIINLFEIFSAGIFELNMEFRKRQIDLPEGCYALTQFRNECTNVIDGCVVNMFKEQDSFTLAVNDFHQIRFNCHLRCDLDTFRAFHKREKVTNLLDQPFRMSEKFQNKIKRQKNNSSEIL